MDLKICVTIWYLIMINLNFIAQVFAAELVNRSVNKSGSNNLDSIQQVNKLTRTTPIYANVAQSGRTNVEARIFKPIFRKIFYKQRVSPLYLINGTVCRFFNFRPVCTTLSTTGLSVGASGGGGGGSGGGAARPSGGSSGGSGGGSSGGGSGSGAGGSRPSGGSSGGSSGGGLGGGSGGSSGGGSGGQRPATSGLQASSSSVQFANQPVRGVAALMQDDQQDLYVEKRMNNSTDADLTTSVQNISDSQQAQPLAFVVKRRPLSFLPFRSPTQIYAVAHRQEGSTKKDSG